MTATDLLTRAQQALADIGTLGPLSNGELGIMYDKDGDEALSVSARYLSISQREAAVEAFAAAPKLVRGLCALAEAQQARVAALEDALREFVGTDDPKWTVADQDGDPICCYCGEWFGARIKNHAPDCPVAQARALLGE